MLHNLNKLTKEKRNVYSHNFYSTLYPLSKVTRQEIDTYCKVKLSACTDMTVKKKKPRGIYKKPHKMS